MSYAAEVHDRLNSLPPLPVRRTVEGCIGTRLICDLLPKKRYCLNLPYLQLTLRLGGTLDKIHNVLRFRQKKFLKSYCEQLCLLRQNATNQYTNMLAKSLGIFIL